MKESNPKASFGDNKVGLSKVPTGVIYGIACAMAEGGMKYGPHNYRAMGCKHSTYFDAAVGHLAHWWEGEDIDAESGLHHLLKAAASIVVMMDSILMGNDMDDRPIRYPGHVNLRINPIIAELKKKYPNPVEPFTQKRKEEEAILARESGPMLAARGTHLRKLNNDRMTEAKRRKIEKILSEDDDDTAVVHSGPEKLTAEDLSPFFSDLVLLDLGKSYGCTSETEARLGDVEQPAFPAQPQPRPKAVSTKLHCSDCHNCDPSISLTNMATCRAGKILLERDPRVEGCSAFLWRAGRAS